MFDKWRPKSKKSALESVGFVHFSMPPQGRCSVFSDVFYDSIFGEGGIDFRGRGDGGPTGEFQNSGGRGGHVRGIPRDILVMTPL